MQLLFEMLHNPETSGLGKAVQEHVLREQFNYQNNLLKWGFGVLSVLISAGVVAAVNDHFALKALSESVNDSKATVDAVKRRNEIIWYEGKFPSRYPGIQQP